jgi:protease-4
MLAGEEESDSQPADALATLSPTPEWRLRTALADVQAILSGPTIQVRCLECAPSAPTRIRGGEIGFFQALLGWLSR